MLSNVKTNTICRSIKKQLLLKINYKKGQDRIIEPHMYGLDKYGSFKLSAYQISGFSISGKSSGWKLFKDEFINNLEELDHQFQVRADYIPAGIPLEDVICKI